MNGDCIQTFESEFQRIEKPSIGTKSKLGFRWSISPLQFPFRFISIALHFSLAHQIKVDWVSFILIPFFQYFCKVISIEQTKREKITMTIIIILISADKVATHTQKWEFNEIWINCVLLQILLMAGVVVVGMIFVFCKYIHFPQLPLQRFKFSELSLAYAYAYIYCILWIYLVEFDLLPISSFIPHANSRHHFHHHRHRRSHIATINSIK